jgi:hypothetical protein
MLFSFYAQRSAAEWSLLGQKSSASQERVNKKLRIIFSFSIYHVSYILFSMYDIIVPVINVRLIFKDKMVIEWINQ